MKILKSILVLTMLALSFSCSENDEMQLQPIEAKRFDNLHAPQNGGQGQGPISGQFVKFDFSIGATTISETEWDIAFRGTTIIVNGGESQGTLDEPERSGNAAAYIEETTFTDLEEIEETLFVQDSPNGLAIPTGGGNGWYDYIPFPVNLVTPRAGRILVFRTRDNRYAKVEILSYYKDAPANPDGNLDEPRYYTFNYEFQPNADITSF